VIAGKGHEDYQIVGQDVRPFSDRSVVLDALGEEA
jgi:UDP-N-acetylmuramyl tripeptide synthase